MELGYARVSSREQDTAIQIDALKTAKVVAYWEEQQSGIKRREALEELLGLLRPGDVLIVYKVDRLARSLQDLLRIADRITAAGAQLRSLTEPIETVTPIGRVIFQILGAFAEFERNVIRERCQAGREAALARGVRFGRPKKIDYEEVFRMRNDGSTYGEISRAMNIARSQAVFIVKKMRLRNAGASLSGPGSMPSAPSP